MSRKKDVNWNLPEKAETWEQVQVALLMDLRDELKRLNNLLGCPNFIAVPEILRGIRRKLPTRRRKKRKPI